LPGAASILDNGDPVGAQGGGGAGEEAMERRTRRWPRAGA
jgi:hypothetical protein